MRGCFFGWHTHYCTWYTSLLLFYLSLCKGYITTCHSFSYSCLPCVVGQWHCSRYIYYRCIAQPLTTASIIVTSLIRRRDMRMFLILVYVSVPNKVTCSTGHIDKRYFCYWRCLPYKKLSHMSQLLLWLILLNWVPGNVLGNKCGVVTCTTIWTFKIWLAPLIGIFEDLCITQFI